MSFQDPNLRSSTVIRRRRRRLRRPARRTRATRCSEEAHVLFCPDGCRERLGSAKAGWRPSDYIVAFHEPSFGLRVVATKTKRIKKVLLQGPIKRPNKLIVWMVKDLLQRGLYRSTVNIQLLLLSFHKISVPSPYGLRHLPERIPSLREPEIGVSPGR